MAYKVCSICEKTLPFDSFATANRLPDRKWQYCRNCERLRKEQGGVDAARAYLGK
ncbi:MAG: hypothetical protein OXL37_16135 [Chloroflexota bacterium]|nr:hypothetical protein [Chloroflexota bacterium]MDE2959817.1 hypothetical protein [Chloroflexota bacterium]